MTETLPNSGNQLAVTQAEGEIAARTDRALVVPAIVADAATGQRSGFSNILASPSATATRAWPICRRRAGSSPGANANISASWSISSRCMSRAYIEMLRATVSKSRPSKQHLAAIRKLFDWLVLGQIVATNPAHAVRGPTHVVKSGKTTVLDADQARLLLDSIPLTRATKKR